MEYIPIYRNNMFWQIHLILQISLMDYKIEVIHKQQGPIKSN